jgi:hypothetical protein
MNPLGWRLAAASLLNLASSQPGWSADWNRDTQNEYGGTYSTNCNNPAAPRVRAVSQGLLVEVGTQRMTGTNLQVAVALFGNQGEPPGQQTVALMSQVRGRFEMNFNVHRDTSGQWGALEGDPKVIAAIGNGLAAQRFRDCDASRSARAAAQMQGARRAPTRPRPAWPRASPTRCASRPRCATRSARR